MQESQLSKRQAAGRSGGLATLARHGREHFSTIGRRGAQVLWQRYQLLPVDVAGWALINRSTGQVKATWG